MKENIFAINKMAIGPDQTSKIQWQFTTADAHIKLNVHLVFNNYNGASATIQTYERAIIFDSVECQGVYIGGGDSMGIFVWIPKTASKRFRQKGFENSRIKNGRRPA